MATKRGLEADEASLQPEKKSKFSDAEATTEGTEGAEAVPDVYEIRMVIDNKEVGTVIGRKGSNIQAVRDTCGVFISIIKTDFKDVPDRVMTIKGTVEQICHAVKVIAQNLLEARAAFEARKNEGAEAVVAADATVGMKILCQAVQAGAIIGKGGEIIKKTMADSGARISLSTEPLTNSTEKSVTITGTPDTVQAGALAVVTQIREYPPKEGTRYTAYVPMPAQPAYAPSPYGAPQGYGNPYGAPPPQQHHQQPPSPYGNPYGAPAPQGYGAPPQAPQGYGAPAPNAYTGTPVAPPTDPSQQLKQTIVIPTVCAGNVIGRGGAIINGIRSQSGTFVSIAKPEPTTPNEREVTITGSTQGIQTAVYLIRQVVEQYEPRA